MVPSYCFLLITIRIVILYKTREKLANIQIDLDQEIKKEHLNEMEMT